MLKRIILDALIFVSLFFWPWWITLFLIVIGLLTFTFVEVFLFAFLFDALFALSSSFSRRHEFLFILGFAFVVLLFIKPSVRGLR